MTARVVKMLFEAALVLAASAGAVMVLGALVAWWQP